MKEEPEITYYTEQQEFKVYVMKHMKGRLIDEEVKGFNYSYDCDYDSLETALWKAKEYIRQIQSNTQ